jgi:hypothetical protein
MTDLSPVLGVGAFIAGSTSGGHITPLLLSSWLLKVPLERSWGVQPFGSGACAWAGAFTLKVRATAKAPNNPFALIVMGTILQSPSVTVITAGGRLGSGIIKRD